MAPIIELALERKADKFRGNIRRTSEDALSDLKDAVAKFNATVVKGNRLVAEGFAARTKASCRSLDYLGIFTGVYLAAFFEVLLYMKRSAKEVDGPSPQ